VHKELSQKRSVLGRNWKGLKSTLRESQIPVPKTTPDLRFGSQRPTPEKSIEFLPLPADETLKTWLPPA
jgi:hypothetical protein